MRKNRADPVHIMKECVEFQKNGFNVTLVTPRVRRKENVKSKDAIWGLYGINKSFKIVELFTFFGDTTSPIIIKFQKFLMFFFYFLGLLFLKKINKNSIIYSKCHLSTFPVVFLKSIKILKCPIAFEAATFTKKKRSHEYVEKHSDIILFFNNYVKQKYINEYKIDQSKIISMGFFTQFNEYKKYTKNLNENKLKRELGIDFSERIIMYTGKISPEMKEIYYILETAKILPEFKFILIGVKDEFKSYFNNYITNNELDNVVMKGFQPLLKIYEFVFCADLLISYYDSYDKLSLNQRSPAKSGVYFCAGKPMIYADLPSLREIFSDDMVYFVPPDSPETLAKNIKEIFNNPIKIMEKTKKSLLFAQLNTYENSFKKISNEILENISKK